MIVLEKERRDPGQKKPQRPSVTEVDDGHGIMCRASRSQGIARAAPRGSNRQRRRESPASSQDARADRCGNTRPTRPATAGSPRPRITNEPRQVENTSSPAMIGGVTALPIRANECTIPCANPQLPCGVQLAIARVAVGKPAPSPNPSASRSRNERRDSGHRARQHRAISRQSRSKSPASAADPAGRRSSRRSIGTTHRESQTPRTPARVACC